MALTIEEQSAKEPGAEIDREHHLRISLLGEFSIRQEDQTVSLPTPSYQSLLAYLITHAGQSHSRQKLAFQFWPDSTETQALTNLRKALHTMRHALPDADGLLHVDRRTVQWRHNGPCDVDVWEFETAVARSQGSNSATDQQIYLEQAASAYHGDFLPGHYDDWVLATRERFRQQYLAALEKQLMLHEDQRQYQAAISLARKLLREDPLHEAAYRRLMSLQALDGNVAGALRTYNTCSTHLQRELGVDPSPATRELYEQLSSVMTPSTPKAAARLALDTRQQAWQILQSTRSRYGSSRAEDALLKGGSQIPIDNLPELLIPFIGREEELAAIASQLALPDCRLLTIHGPGGAGKTQLALEFARRQREQYAQGAFFVPLAGLSSAANLIPTIADKVGLPNRPDRDPRQQLLNFLRSRQLLLLLDNFEHLIEGAGLLVEILQAAPQIHILVTSRNRLQLAAESLFEVRGLHTDIAEDEPAGTQSEAEQMFEAYARRANPKFQADSVERSAIADLCRLVEGMPLAIELTAAWVRSLTTAEILERATVSSKILETANADVPSRLRSVRASFDYSWRLLNEYEQQGLSWLSTFRGGFTRTSAEEIAGVDNRILAGLVDKSILTYDAASGRYSIHELIRQLAEERLVASGQGAEAYEKHRRFFLTYAYSAYTQLESEYDWEPYHEQIGRELDNCRIAFQRSIAVGDTRTAVQLACGLTDYLRDFGLQEEALRYLKESLEADSDSSDPAIRAEAYLYLSYIWRESRGGRNEVIGFADKALSLYRLVGDLEGISRTLFILGRAYHGFDWDRSRAYLSQSVKAYQDAGIESTRSLSISRWLLIKTEILTGNLDEAGLLNDRLHTAYQKDGDEYGLSRTNDNKAYIDYYKGHLDEAQIYAEKSLDFRRSYCHEMMHILPLDILVRIALDKRQLDRARALLLERLSILVNCSNLVDAIHCFDEVAELLLLTDQPVEAAFWIGCFDHAREWAKQPVEPVALPHYKWLISTIRETVGEEAYVAAWQKGYAVPVEEALPLALQMVEQTVTEPDHGHAA